MAWVNLAVVFHPLYEVLIFFAQGLTCLLPSRV
jgi:hypothetical protein